MRIVERLRFGDLNFMRRIGNGERNGEFQSQKNMLKSRVTLSDRVTEENLPPQQRTGRCIRHRCKTRSIRERKVALQSVPCSSQSPRNWGYRRRNANYLNKRRLVKRRAVNWLSRTDIPSRLSERTLVDITIFEGIRTKFEDIIQKSTECHPREDLNEANLQRRISQQSIGCTAENNATYPYCSKIVK